MRPTGLSLFFIISAILFKDAASIQIGSAEEPKEGKGAMKKKTFFFRDIFLGTNISESSRWFGFFDDIIKLEPLNKIGDDCPPTNDSNFFFHSAKEVF